MNSDGRFVTSSLPLAAFLVAGEHLEFCDIALTNPKNAVFVFEDPKGRGRELEKDFSRGALVKALAFHTQLRILRRAVDDKTAAARFSGQDQFNGNLHVRHERLAQR